MNSRKQTVSTGRPEVFCKKKVFLKVSQDSQEKTCVRVSVTCVKPHSATLFKMRLGQKCFPLSFEFRKILKLFFIEYLR